MKTFPDMSASKRTGDSKPRGFLRFLPPFPVFAIQPVLSHVVSSIARRHPELFARLGDNCQKHYLIDPISLPFFLILQPNPQKPKLTAFRHSSKIFHDVIISATFSTLIKPCRLLINMVLMRRSQMAFTANNLGLSGIGRINTYPS